MVNYNGGAYIGACLKSLLSQTLPPIEILLIDNASTDGSPELVQKFFPEIQIIRRERNDGFSRAANEGARRARGEILFFINPDGELTPDGLEKMVRTLNEEPESGAVTARILNVGREPEKGGGTLNPFLTTIPNYFDDPTKAFYPSGAAFAIRKGIVDPPFPDDFFLYFEDVHLGWQIRLSGYEIRKVPEAVLTHHPSSSVRLLPASVIQFHQQRNRLLTFFTFHSCVTLLKLLPLFPLDFLFHLLGCLWLGKSPLPVLSAYAVIFTSPRYLMNRRKKWRQDIRKPEKEILPMFSGRLLPMEGGYLNFLSSLYLRLVLPGIGC